MYPLCGARCKVFNSYRTTNKTHYNISSGDFRSLDTFHNLVISHSEDVVNIYIYMCEYF